MGKAWGGPRGGRLSSGPSAAHSPLLAQQTWVSPAAGLGGKWWGEARLLGEWEMPLGLPHVVPAMEVGEGDPGELSFVRIGGAISFPKCRLLLPFPHRWGLSHPLNTSEEPFLPKWGTLSHLPHMVYSISIGCPLPRCGGLFLFSEMDAPLPSPDVSSFPL